MTKTLISDPILEQFFFFFFHEFYLYLLDIVPSYHPIQFKGKLIYQTWENGKRKLILGQILANFAQIWAPQIYFMRFTSTNNYTLFQATILCNFQENFKKLQKMAANLTLAPILTSLPKNLDPQFFLWVLPLLVCSNGLVVKAVDFQSRDPVFKTIGWLQGQLSLSSFHGR